MTSNCTGRWVFCCMTIARAAMCSPCVTSRTRRTKNLRAVQLLLGHSKLESTVRYLGIEVDDALEMAEQTEV